LMRPSWGAVVLRVRVWVIRYRSQDGARRGLVELEVNEDPAPSRIRKKVRDVKMQWFKNLFWKKISSNYLQSLPSAIQCVKCLMAQSITLRIGGHSRVASTIPRPYGCCCSVRVATVMPPNRHVFKNALQVLAERPEPEIRGAHYPPYCSKHNSIETGFFCTLLAPARA
jgi:hypothetical protein